MQYKEVFIGMSTKELDLVIIGAGATGSSIALEACKRGLKVALIDQGDISGGTSCRSTKLLHGGVRYLELAFKNFDLAQLKLVREALFERGYWLKNAPFLTREIELAIPTSNCFNKGYYRLGLAIYDLLSGSQRISHSRILSSQEISTKLPYLGNCTGGGVAYSDGQFNDSRLNLLLALTAEREGAIIANYCNVIDFEYDLNSKLKAVITQDLSSTQKRWEAKVIINATGIQADAIREKVDPNVEKRITTSRGVHIVLNENLCPDNLGLLLPATEDGRVLFALPFFNHTLVGTTDTPCDISNARQPSKEEEQYLINHVKVLFPRILKPTIKSRWAGGRPLLQPKETASSSQIVREHEIELLPCGLISAMGGKWTTCRKIALDTLNVVEEAIGKSLVEVKNIPLLGSNINTYETKLALEKQRNELKKYLPQTNLLEKQIMHLEGKYGLRALELIQSNKENDREPLSEIIPICSAEIIEDINYEHAKTATDILARRSRLAMIDYEEAIRLLPIVQKYLSEASLPNEDLNLKS